MTHAHPILATLLALGSAAAISNPVLAENGTTETQSALREFHIPPQSLAEALKNFSRQSDLQLFYNADLVAGMGSPGVNGRYTQEQALERLLQGSQLSYRVRNDNTLILEKSAVKVVEPQSATTLPAVKVVGQAQYDATDPYNEDYVLPNATSGTKTDTPIMETPLNVQVISKQVLKDQQVITLADSLKNVSGVVTNAQGAGGYSPYFNGGGASTDITLRGFVAETTFRNGFRLQQGGSNREMANVESVEVLKGPAAILYGLVEPGGMVNVITKQPLATPYYAFNQQFGSYDNYRTTLDATGPVTGNKDILYRMNMYYQNSGSFRDFVSTDDLFLAPVLKWVISPKTQATVEFEYNHKHNGADTFFNPFIGGQLTNTPISRNYGEKSPSITETFFGSFNWSHQFNDDWSIKHRLSVNQQRGSVNNYQQPIGTVTDNFMQNVFVANTPNNGISVLRQGFSDVSQYNTYATNLDLTGHFDTFGLKHTLLIGGDYYRLNNTLGLNYSQAQSTGAFSYIDPYNPVHPGNPIDLGFVSTPFVTANQADQYGLYIQDQIKLPYDLHVTGGIRYQNLHRNLTTVQGGVTTERNSQSQDAVTPRVGILWNPQSWISLYANYAESFGATSFGLVYAGPSQFRSIDPTSATQYEGGIKTEFFDGRLRATLAYYDLTKTNIATSDPNPLHQCGGGCAIAIGAVRSRGPELDIQGEILPGWNTIATWANTDIIVAKTNEKNDSLNGLNVGDRMINVPRNTASFWSTYELLDTDFKGLKFGGGVTVRDGQLGSGGTNLDGSISNPSIKTPGYATLGLMAAYSRAFGKSKITVQFNIDNLLDKRYAINTNGYLNDPAAGISGAFVSYGAPRTFLGSISIQY
ncbi:TonB-dependent siderophore receptor [Methylomonas albis]|uniref:TonB-dependent receptor n=1 Tax=Methylomonas albis TaxID=1854563 RepID=A0ABR9CZ63_9GAMM|nr:TonB-dependent receptor [Methylomonas albis]MBD9355826.1 TonB-dependent receptor [Methylomonas albis]